MNQTGAQLPLVTNDITAVRHVSMATTDVSIIKLLSLNMLGWELEIWDHIWQCLIHVFKVPRFKGRTTKQGTQLDSMLEVFFL